MSSSKKKTISEIKYIKSFDDKTNVAYKIAQEHLQSSFSLKKSIGFQKFKASKDKK